MPRKCSGCGEEELNIRGCPHKSAYDQAFRLLVHEYVDCWMTEMTKGGLTYGNIIERWHHATWIKFKRGLETKPRKLFTDILCGHLNQSTTWRPKSILALRLYSYVEEKAFDFIEESCPYAFRAYMTAIDQRNRRRAHAARGPQLEVSLKAPVEGSVETKVFECAVCMDDCDVMKQVSYECGHKFCAPCFINMAKTAKRACRKMTCAMCRADMKKLVAFDTTENKERLVEFCKVITA